MARSPRFHPPPSADELISVRIAAAMPTLTPIHRRMGAFVLANLFRSATMRIDELASAVGRVGGDGQPLCARARLRRLSGVSRGARARLRSDHRARRAPAHRAANRPRAARRCSMHRWNRPHRTCNMTRSAIDGDVADALVDAILDARRVFVLGYGASAFLAGLMEHGLTPYCANVQSLALMGGPSHAARRLFNASRGDLLVAIAFPRYVDDTIELARLAAGHGVRVVALTDSAASPLAQVADLVLTIRTERRLAANCDTAVLAVIEAICDAVAHRAKRSVEAASGLTEFVLPWLVKPARCIFPRRPRASRQKQKTAKHELRHPSSRSTAAQARSCVPRSHAEAEAQYHAALHGILDAGQRILADGGSALDAVTEAVRLLEDCPLFNAGHGAVFTAAGTHELDASMMDGATLEAGAVCCVTRVKNPVLAARRVLEKASTYCSRVRARKRSRRRRASNWSIRRTFIPMRVIGNGSTRAASQGTMLDHDAASMRSRPMRRDPSIPTRSSARSARSRCDAHGHVAAATSTGGITNKQPGRVGDAPLIGAGCYANDATCAVSTPAPARCSCACWPPTTSRRAWSIAARRWKRRRPKW